MSGSNKESTKRSVNRRHVTDKDEVDYSTYIHKLVKTLTPNNNISKGARAEINQLVLFAGRKLVDAARSVLRVQSKVTVSSDTIVAATRIILRGSLLQGSLSAINDALKRYDASSKVKDQKRRRIESRAGLIFSVSRTRHLLEQGLIGRISKRASISLAAVLQYISGQILQSSASVADSVKKTTISTRHLRLAVGTDEELSSLFSQVIFSGGVVPRNTNIKSSTKRKRSKTQTKGKSPVKKTSPKKLPQKRAPVSKAQPKKEAPVKKLPVKKTITAKAPTQRRVVPRRR